MTHHHYTASWRRCRECGRLAGDCSEYCPDCQDQIDREDAEAREQAEMDAGDYAEPACTCSTFYVPSNAHTPPERVLDRLCPLHGDSDPDRAYDEWRDAQIDNP